MRQRISEYWLHSSVVEVKGENRLEAITVNDAMRSEKQTVPTEGLFIFIGAQRHTDWLSGVVARDTYWIYPDRS